MRRLPDPLHDERSMRLQNRLTMTAHLARRHRTRRAIALPPLHDGRHRNIEPGRHSMATLAGLHRLHGSFTKIIRKRADPPTAAPHPPRTPPPSRLFHEDHSKEVGPSDAGLRSSQHLESQTAARRNPSRFNQLMNRSKAWRVHRGRAKASQATGSAGLFASGIVEAADDFAARNRME